MKKYREKLATLFTFSFLSGRLLKLFLWIGNVHILFSRFGLKKMSGYRAESFKEKKRFFRKFIGVLLIILAWFPYTIIMFVLVAIASIVQGVILLIWGKTTEVVAPPSKTPEPSQTVAPQTNKPKPIIQEYIPQEDLVSETEKLILELMHFPKDQNNILFAHNRTLDEELRKREYFLKRREETQAQEMDDVRSEKRELGIERELLKLERKKLEIESMQNTSESDRTEQLRQLKLEQEIIKRRRENERGW